LQHHKQPIMITYKSEIDDTLNDNKPFQVLKNNIVAAIQSLKGIKNKIMYISKIKINNFRNFKDKKN